MSTRRLLCFATLLTVVGTAATAHAADRTISAKKLQMKRSASGKESLLFVSKDPLFPIGAGPEAPAYNGARIDVVVGNGASHVAFDVPGGVGNPGWMEPTASAKYSYKNRQAPAGPTPVQLLLLNHGKQVKLKVKQLGVPLGDIGSVAVRIAMGSTRMCTVFSATRATIIKDTASQFTAVGASASPALPDCSGQTLAGAMCGNGIAEMDEDCDGADDTACPGQCDGSCTCPPPVCGDGHVNQPSEDCDGADDTACSGQCSGTCTCPPPVCGDDHVNRAAEECDGTDDDACPGECQPSCVCLGVCGDGIINQPSETCDPPAGNCDCRPPGQPGECTCAPICSVDGPGCNFVGCCDWQKICIPAPNFGGWCCYPGTGHACTSNVECCTGSCSGGTCRFPF